MHRLIGFSADREWFGVGLSRCRHRRKIDAFNDKWIRALIKNRAYSVDQSCLRTPVLSQGVMAMRGFCRSKISKDVGAAKSIDRLLRIADKKHRPAVIAIN